MAAARMRRTSNAFAAFKFNKGLSDNTKDNLRTIGRELGLILGEALGNTERWRPVPGYSG
jgi:hypothetical protein